MSLDKIKKIYDDNLVNKPDEVALLLVVFRFLSPPFVYLLSEWKVNPLHINYTNLFIVLIALTSFIFCSNPLISISLLILWQFIDTLDGGVARTRNIVNNYGGFVDYMSGMVIITFLPIMVAITVSNQIINGLYKCNLLLSNISPEFILMIGGFSSLTAIFSRFINHTIKIRFGADNSKKVISGKKTNNFFKIIIINIEGVGGINLIILLMFYLMEILPAYLILYALINILIAVYVFFRALVDYKDYSSY